MPSSQPVALSRGEPATRLDESDGSGEEGGEP